MFRKKNKGRLINGSDILLLICGASLAFAFSFGANIAIKGYKSASTSSLIIQMIVLTFIFCLIFVFLESMLPSIRDCSLKMRKDILYRFVAECIRKHPFIIPFTALLVCWMIWIVALYPGAMNWDTFYQIWMTYPENHPIASDWEISNQYLPYALSDHHPLFDTLLYGLFARVSHIVFGSWNIGVFLFIIVQVLCFAALISLALRQLHDLYVPSPVIFVAFVFFAFFPVIPAYCATMLKDSSFTLFYLAFIMASIEVARTRGLILKNRKAALLYTLIALFCALTKKTGMYIAIPTVILFSIIYRQVWKQLCLNAFISMVIMLVVLPLFIFPFLDVAPGGKQEMLSLPFQMTARFVFEHEDEVTNSERSAIDAVLHYDNLASRYKFDTTDPVKNQFIPSVSNDDLAAYIKVWVLQGLRRPDCYISALMGVTSRFFAPSASLGILTFTGDLQHGGSPYVWQPSQTARLRDALGAWCVLLRSTPVVSLLFNAGLYSLWLPLLCLYCFFKDRGKRWILPLFIPVGISFASCLISPIFDTRYVLPMIFESPILFSLLFSMRDQC